MLIAPLSGHACNHTTVTVVQYNYGLINTCIFTVTVKLRKDGRLPSMNRPVERIDSGDGSNMLDVGIQLHQQQM